MSCHKFPEWHRILWLQAWSVEAVCKRHSTCMRFEGGYLFCEALDKFIKCPRRKDPSPTEESKILLFRVFYVLKTQSTTLLSLSWKAQIQPYLSVQDFEPKESNLPQHPLNNDSFLRVGGWLSRFAFLWVTDFRGLWIQSVVSKGYTIEFQTLTPPHFLLLN